MRQPGWVAGLPHLRARSRRPWRSVPLRGGSGRWCSGPTVSRTVWWPPHWPRAPRTSSRPCGRSTPGSPTGFVIAFSEHLLELGPAESLRRGDRPVQQPIADAQLETARPVALRRLPEPSRRAGDVRWGPYGRRRDRARASQDPEPTGRAPWFVAGFDGASLYSWGREPWTGGHQQSVPVGLAAADPVTGRVRQIVDAGS